MKLEQELNTIKNRIGLVGGSLTINEYDDAEENITACINPNNWNIEFNLRKDYNPIRDRRQKAYARKKKIQDGKKQMLEDILHHELGHWELPFTSGFGCPYDIYNHDLILEAIKQALPQDKLPQADYVANAFEDLLVNTRAREFTGSFAGQVLFFDEQGIKMGKQGYTAFYEAFVKLNILLWGDNYDKVLVKRHFKNTGKIADAVNSAIRDLGLNEKENITRRLFNREKWPEFAGRFARALAPLLEEQPKERLSAYKSDSHKEPKPGNGVEEKLATKEGKEHIASKRYKEGKSPSPNIQTYEQLDALYRSLAQAIPVKVEAMTREQSMEIGPLNFRPFDEETDDIRKIKPTRLYADDEGNITFGYQRMPITMVAKSKIQPRSFPDFKAVFLDNSGSMKLNVNNESDGSGNPVNIGGTRFIPWGDKSKYHYALLGVYGVENFLQAQGIAQYIGHGLSLYSNTTRYQEAEYADLSRLRKLALSPEFGNTQVDAGMLLRALNGRESFVLSISDGEIMNWAAAREEFLRLAKENYFAHIQIGASNQFTKDLEADKLPVFYVNSGKELSRLMVNVATETYKRFTKI